MSAPETRSVESVVDWRGQAYVVGQTVLYPRMSGRSCEIQEGTVLEIVTWDELRWQFDRETRVRFQALEEQRKVKIQPTRSSRGFWRDSEKRPVWIQLGENVTAVPG